MLFYPFDEIGHCYEIRRKKWDCVSYLFLTLTNENEAVKSEHSHGQSKEEILNTVYFFSVRSCKFRLYFIIMRPAKNIKFYDFYFKWQSINFNCEDFSENPQVKNRYDKNNKTFLAFIIAIIILNFDILKYIFKVKFSRIPIKKTFLLKVISNRRIIITCYTHGWTY